MSESGIGRHGNKETSHDEIRSIEKHSDMIKKTFLIFNIAVFSMLSSDAHAVGIPSLESNKGESTNDNEKLQIITSVLLLLTVGIGGGIYEYVRRNRKNESK